MSVEDYFRSRPELFAEAMERLIAPRLFAAGAIRAALTDEELATFALDVLDEPYRERGLFKVLESPHAGNRLSTELIALNEWCVRKGRSLCLLATATSTTVEGKPCKLTFLEVVEPASNPPRTWRPRDERLADGVCVARAPVVKSDLPAAAASIIDQLMKANLWV